MLTVFICVGLLFGCVGLLQSELNDVVWDALFANGGRLHWLFVIPQPSKVLISHIQRIYIGPNTLNVVSCMITL